MNCSESKYLDLQKCPLCGSLNSQLLFKANDILMGKPGEYNIEECTECSFRFTNPRPYAEDIFNYYTSDYHCYRDDNRKKNDVTESSDLENKVFTSNSGYTLHGGFWGSRGWVFPNLQKGAKILEIGCGSGGFIRECIARRWETLGMDLNPDLEPVITQMGAKFLPTTLPIIDLPDSYLDAVFAWQVIEHLYEPVETLTEIQRILKPNGILAFSVPNSDCWQFHLFKDKWAGLQVPTHVSHFSEKTIRQVVEKSGLKVVEIYGQNTIGCLCPSILFSMGRKNVSLSDQWTPLSSVNKIIDRFLSILISLLFGRNQAERLTVICINNSQE
ncbi:class I SAM-dependent methyltransferase [Anabaena sphaerica]|nr:class I SAM-dependent methyltransferase [Anabaena sphaerica]